MLRWLRTQAKPFAVLGVTGLLGQTLMLCCLSAAHATPGRVDNASASGYCHTAAVTQPHYTSTANAVTLSQDPAPGLVGNGDPHCPPADKGNCCDSEAKAAARDDAGQTLVQTVDFSLDLILPPATRLSRPTLVLPHGLWLGPPPTLASPPLFLSHCTFRE